jgi:hypothetical protein
MSLSVEHLKQVLDGFESDELAVYDDADSPCRGAGRIVIDAIRELIKIKETKPDAYISAIDFSRLPNADIIGGFPVSRDVELDDDIQLIRKPT